MHYLCYHTPFSIESRDIKFPFKKRSQFKEKPPVNNAMDTTWTWLML